MKRLLFSFHKMYTSFDNYVKLQLIYLIVEYKGKNNMYYLFYFYFFL